MKHIMTIRQRGLVDVDEEHHLIHVYDYEKKCWTHFDYDGKRVSAPIANTDHDDEDDDEYEPDDPTFYGILNDSLYSYTTHEVEETVDETFGLFGIKDREGNIIIEEKFWDIKYFMNGMCPVREVNGNWGCINEKCELVLPCIYEIPPVFNKYGIAYGNDSLIDMQGNELPDTPYGNFEYVDEEERYYTLIVFSDEQSEQISRTGRAENVTENIYDTKKREYVLKDIPEGKLDYAFFDGEPCVIRAAAELMDEYDSVSVEGEGIIIGQKGDQSVIYDYYM